MEKKRILIGVQPTGKLTLGNYLGCLKKGLEYQELGHDVIFMIANYHSLTTDSYSDITEKELIRLGCKNIIHQTPAYTELFFKLCCIMNIGTLLKMPQYKDKKDSVKFDLGLLLYPVLMTADIIINDPDIVIIGRDQLAHLELCNDIAKRYNGKYYDYEFGDYDKIMSLKDPLKKMSKSLGEKHVLYLFDEDYRAKMRSANMDEVAIQNVSNIANGLGVDPSIFSSNLELKMAIAERMEVIFA
jgi:tryptophanyl-tRNA synthetase